MRVRTKLFATVIAVLPATTAFAGQKGHAPASTHAPSAPSGSTHGNNPHVSVSTTFRASPQTTRAANGHGASGPSAHSSTHGPSAKTTSPHGGGSAAKTTASAHGNPHKTTSSAGTTAGTGTPSGNTTGGSTGSTTGTSAGSTTGSTSSGGSTTTTAPNPIAQKISAKPQLSAKVQKMLPSGVSVDSASAGFKNQGQFLAALHVSQNLNIPFSDLKLALTGVPVTSTPPAAGTATNSGSTTSGSTSSSTLSLGQAIKKLRPSADASGATAQAQSQAATDLASTSSSTSASSSSTTSPSSTSSSTTKKSGRR